MTAGRGRSCACGSYSSQSILSGMPTAAGRRPDGVFTKPTILPEGESFARVEAPRGELFYYVNGKRSKELDRVKIRTSTYANGIGIVPLIKGSQLADVGLITITFDPCIGCLTGDAMLKMSAHARNLTMAMW